MLTNKKKMQLTAEITIKSRFVGYLLVEHLFSVARKPFIREASSVHCTLKLANDIQGTYSRNDDTKIQLILPPITVKILIIVMRGRLKT